MVLYYVHRKGRQPVAFHRIDIRLKSGQFFTEKFPASRYPNATYISWQGECLSDQREAELIAERQRQSDYRREYTDKLYGAQATNQPVEGVSYDLNTSSRGGSSGVGMPDVADAGC